MAATSATITRPIQAPAPQMDWRTQTREYLGSFGIYGSHVEKELEALRRHDIPFTTEQRKFFAQDALIRTENTLLQSKPGTALGIFLAATGTDGTLMSIMPLNPNITPFHGHILNHLNVIVQTLVLVGEALPQSLSIAFLTMGVTIAATAAAFWKRSKNFLHWFHQNPENVVLAQ